MLGSLALTRRSRRLGFVALGLVTSGVLAGCSMSQGPGGSSGLLLHEGPFACGTGTCGDGQMCVVRMTIAFSDGPDDSYTCEPIPGGCSAGGFCDCAATEPGVAYDDRTIIGCSAFEERALTIVIVPCGNTECPHGQYCLTTRDASGALNEQVCRKRPGGCGEMCNAGCGASGELLEGGEVKACSSFSVDVVAP